MILTQRKYDEFEVGSILGVGTVGTIYEAYDKTNQQSVALKCLLPSVSSDQIVQARFEREMLILEKLSHPNIVRYFGGGRNGDQLFFAMELLTGGSLKGELARTGVFNWIEAATCGVQICSALQYAHNHGVLHRDLKPSNLLFNEKGELKLVDFGIARDTHEADITSQGLTVGSCYYMSPEQICGDSSITGHTDLYALGTVLFELLTGRPPFVGDNFAQLMQQQLTQAPPSLTEMAPRTPPKLEQLIMSLLAKKPQDRPFNARAVQGELLGMLNQELPQASGDVPAADAIQFGRQAIVKRLQSSPHDVSWSKLMGIAVGLLLVSLAAWFFGR